MKNEKTIKILIGYSRREGVHVYTIRQITNCLDYIPGEEIDANELDSMNRTDNLELTLVEDRPLEINIPGIVSIIGS